MLPYETCNWNKKRDKIVYIKVIFSALQFLIENKIFSRWFLIFEKQFIYFENVDDFISQVVFRKKEQFLSLDVDTLAIDA